MKLQKRTKQRSAALLNRKKFSFAGFFSTETLGFFSNFAQKLAALNWKKWAKSPFFTIQRSAAPPRARIGKDAKGSFAQRALNRKKSASRFFIHKPRSLFTASLLSALLFAQCANVKGIFTDDNSTASATPPPDPSQCELEAQEQGLSFAGGDGTEDTPFEVSSPEQLANIGQLLYCNYRLTQDIGLSVVANWTPLGAESPCDGGNDDACFQGRLDGNDFMISDLTVNITEDYGGLFGYTGEHAEIRSVGLSGVDITAGGNSGGLVGNNTGSISNSYTTGAVSSASDRIGGLVGWNDDGSISNSYSTSTVTGKSNLGSLVGDNSGSISNSYATGTVSSGESNGGGLVGLNTGSISSSYAIGTVNNTASVTFVYIGGLVGFNTGSISNSYAAGAVASTNSGAAAVGGLMGESTSTETLAGTLYFVESGEKDTTGNTPVTLDGLGGGSCDAAVCAQAMGGDDAARATWLADSLDETDDGGLNWDAQLDGEGNAVWGNLNAAGFPCLKNMPTGAPSC